VESKYLVINASKEKISVEELDREDVIGPISWGLYCHLEKYGSYGYDVFDEHNVLCFGAGKLAWSEIYGTRRLVFTFRSPLWGGFFLSSMGGAAYVFRYLGVDFAVVEGKAREPLIVALKSDANGNIEAKFESISEDRLFEMYRGYGGKIGAFALTKYVAEKYGKWYSETKAPMRIITVGPASAFTRNGALISYASRDDRLEGKPVDFSARGGPGSVLYRAHKVVAIVFGGNYVKKPRFPRTDLSNFNVLNEVFNKYLRKSMNEAVMDATVKYRYDPKTDSGGTFGNNYAYYGGLNPIFNWNHIYLEKSERDKFYREVINKLFVEPFNEEAIRKKRWRTCDEPCTAVCKKMYRMYKVDYEPYCASAANTGIFVLDYAAEVVDLVDAMGFDAIEFGNTAPWIMESIVKGLLKPEDLGLKSKPYFNHELYYDLNNAVKFSKHNAEIIKEFAWKLAFGEGETYRLIGEGIRRAAKKFDEMFSENVSKVGLRFEDLAIYIPFGPDGSLTPAMYWGPGNIAPLPIVGKYLTYYHGIFLEPEDLASLALNRAVKELYSEEGGLCRFHRGWVEKILPKLYYEAYGLEVDFDIHGKKLLQKIVEYDKKAGYKPVFWESMKTIDYLTLAAKEYGAEQWYEKLKREGTEAAKEFWLRFLRKEEEILEISWEPTSSALKGEGSL